MKKILCLFGLLYCSYSAAYTPDLILIGQTSVGKHYLDKNSIKRINTSLKQAVIYEKFSKPVKFDSETPYQSAIKYYLFNCKKREIVDYKGELYQGLTSNTAFISGFNNAKYINGDTGETHYSYDILEFATLAHLKRYGTQGSYITPYYQEAFDIVCR